jgi:hypothetical protein
MTSWRCRPRRRTTTNDLESVDDIVEPLIKQIGAVNGRVTYLARAQDRWLAVPATIGSQIKGRCSCIALIKQHAGIDVQACVRRAVHPRSRIARQIYTQGIMTKMTVRHLQGEPMENTLSWGESDRKVHAQLERRPRALPAPVAIGQHRPRPLTFERIADLLPADPIPNAELAAQIPGLGGRS